MADGDAEVELEEIRYGNRVFSGSSAPALHEHPINKDLIAHFKSKGDSVSWGIAESIEKYEEDTEKKVSRGTDIAALYDQETECELAKEVENRIEEVLSDDAAIMDDAQVKKRAKLASRFGDENADIGFAPIPSGFVSYVYEVVDALKFHPWSRGCGFETSKTDDEDAFDAKFTHQVFREDESVFGYAGLRMDVFVCRTSLRALLKTKYDNKISSAMNPADPVEDQMREWFDSEGLCELYTDEKRFEAEAEMVEPCGGGTIVAESQRDDGVTTRIQAYELATNEEARKWHAAMEAYAVFFIDAASKIDNTDPRWTLLVATRHHADGRWETAGFTTVYRFYSYPDSERARLSQILVLPPYQRQGLGGKMLEAVRKLALDRSMRDLTIEDPTDQLQRLRDVHDVKACLNLPELIAKVQMAAVEAARAPTQDARRSALACTQQVFDMAAAKLKICKPQMRRIWEALLFIFAKRSNAPENSLAADAFKELIVCRLKAMYNSNSDKDIGTKRIISIGENDFIMTKARVLVGEAPQMENPAEGQADITEALGELFQECVQNLSFIYAQCPSGEPMVDSTTSPIQSKANTNVHSEPFSRAGQRLCRREQVVVDEDQNPRLATTGRVFKHKNVAAVKAADTKRYDRGSKKSGRAVVNGPHMQGYKGGRIAQGTGEDDKEVLNDISNVNQPQQQHMKDLCAMYNCEEVPTQGDGNCQFRALSLGLYGSEDRHAEVRTNIVQHLRENSERYFQFVESEFFADYVNRISLDGQWGDAITLQAFVEYYSRGVRVLSDNEQNPVFDHAFEDSSEDPITITHYGEVHYNGTTPIRT